MSTAMASTTTRSERMDLLAEAMELEAGMEKALSRLSEIYAQLGMPPSISAPKPQRLVMTNPPQPLATQGPMTNRQRIMALMADGAKRTTREIFEALGVSTINTVQSETSLLVKDAKLVRDGDGVRIPR